MTKRPLKKTRGSLVAPALVRTFETSPGANGPAAEAIRVEVEANRRASRRAAFQVLGEAPGAGGSRPGPVQGGVRSKWFEVDFRAEGDPQPVEIRIYKSIGGGGFWEEDTVEADAFAGELAKIPKGTKINCRINSPGGLVSDGMAIYNRLLERQDDVTTYIDGMAASIAGVIFLAGKKRVMMIGTRFMMHDPWGYAEGNAADMRRAADVMDKCAVAMAEVYAARSKMSVDKVRKLMKDETWMYYQEAQANNICTDQGGVAEPMALAACARFDLGRYRRVPEDLARGELETAAVGRINMNRAQMMARLRELGVQFAETATDAELTALLATHNTPGRVAQGQAQGAGSGNQGQPQGAAQGQPQGASAPNQGQPQGAAQGQPQGASAPNQGQSQGSGQSAPQAAAPSAATQPVLVLDTATMATIAALQATAAQERRNRITARVTACVDDDRIDALQAPRWIERAMADEAVLADLETLPSRPPGARPVRPVITGESALDIQRGLLAFRNASMAWVRGNDVPVAVISENARNMARMLAKHRDRLTELLASNSISSDLKRNVILSDIMRAFKRRLVALNVFSTKFTNVPLEGTNKVVIPFWDLDTTASLNFHNSTGYLFSDNSAENSRDVVVNKRKYQPFHFSSDEFRRQPYFNPPMAMTLKAEQLGLDVWNDVLSVIDIATYGSSVLDVEPGTMDTDDVVMLRKRAEDADWPTVGRACVLGTDAEAALLMDESLKHFMNSNSTDPLRAGASGRLLNFEMFYSPRIPTNGEDLGGFICLPPAVLVATAPIAPAPGVRQNLLSYDLVVDPDTGLAFEYRYWGEPQADKDREVVECNYGFKKGLATALLRITKGTPTHSSSSSASSQSSANSSSSSSSLS